MSNKLERFKGDTYSVEAVLTKDNTPIDFTDGHTALFSFTKGSVNVTIQGVNGTVNGEISFPFPSDVRAGTYKYDVQVTAPSGEIRTYVKDDLEIISDITS